MYPLCSIGCAIMYPPIQLPYNVPSVHSTGGNLVCLYLVNGFELFN